MIIINTIISLFYIYIMPGAGPHQPNECVIYKITSIINYTNFAENPRHACAKVT